MVYGLEDFGRPREKVEPVMYPSDGAVDGGCYLAWLKAGVHVHLAHGFCLLEGARATPVQVVNGRDGRLLGWGVVIHDDGHGVDMQPFCGFAAVGAADERIAFIAWGDPERHKDTVGTDRGDEPLYVLFVEAEALSGCYAVVNQGKRDCVDGGVRGGRVRALLRWLFGGR